MKKLVLTLVLGVFAFGASGFDTYKSPQSNCVKEARAIVQDTADQFGDDYMNIYTDCIESL